MNTLAPASLFTARDRRPKGPEVWILETSRHRYIFGRVQDLTREEVIAEARALGYEPIFASEPYVLLEVA